MAAAAGAGAARYYRTAADRTTALQLAAVELQRAVAALDDGLATLALVQHHARHLSSRSECRWYRINQSHALHLLTG